MSDELECTKRGYTNEHQARRMNKAMGNSIRTYICDICPGRIIHVTKERYGYSDWHKRKRERARRER